MADAPATTTAPAATGSETSAAPAAQTAAEAKPAAQVSTDPIAQAAAEKAAATGGDAKPGDKPGEAAKTGEGEKKGDADPAKAKDGEGKDGKKDGEGQQGEFKATDFKLPEGFTMNETALTELNAALKDAVGEDGKFKADSAQSLINLHAKMIQETLAKPEVRQGIFEQMAADRLKTWADETIKDPTVGGDKVQENLATAMTAIEGLKIPGLAELVKDPALGLGSNVKVIGLFLKVGQRMKEAGFNAGQASGGTKPEAHNVMFGNGENK